MTDKKASRQRRAAKTRVRIAPAGRRAPHGAPHQPAHLRAGRSTPTGGKVLASASTLEKEVRATHPNGGNKEAAALVGKRIAEKAKAAGVTEVAFDRAGFSYHGRVKALADAAREGGLKF